MRVTDLTNFTKCPRLDYFKRVLCLEDESPSRLLGTAVHTGLKEFYSGEETRSYVDGLEKYPDLNLIEQVEGILHYYKECEAKNPLLPSDATIIGLEEELKSNKIPLEGRVDMLYQRGDVIYIVDHKTYRQYNPWEYSMSYQVLGYSYLVYETYGTDNLRFVFNCIPTSLPVPPRFTKKNELTKSKFTTTEKMLNDVGIQPPYPSNVILWHPKRIQIPLRGVMNIVMKSLLRVIDSVPQGGMVPYGCYNGMVCRVCAFNDICLASVFKNEDEILRLAALRTERIWNEEEEE